MSLKRSIRKTELNEIRLISPWGQSAHERPALTFFAPNLKISGEMYGF